MFLKKEKTIAKSEANTNAEYVNISSVKNFQTGYVIVDDYVFFIKKRIVIDIIDLSADTVSGKVLEAREELDLSDQTIYYEDSHKYNPDTLFESGRFITDAEYEKELNEEECACC